MIKIYGIKNCDTMKKAFDWLDKHKIAYEFHDYKQLGIDEETLKSWMRKEPLDKIINTRSTTWKELTDAQRETARTHAGAIPIIQKYTSMIKRPLVDLGKDHYLLGFKAEDWEKEFGV